MQELACQIRGGSLHPLTLEDEQSLAEYKENQIVRVKMSGIQKPRSYEQLKLYWQLCKVVTENTDDPAWSTPEKVSFQIKVALQFCDLSQTIVDAKGTVHFSWRSISFPNLKHMEACNYFDRAFEVMAKKLGISVLDLLGNVDG
jgi:hypothetical protein